MAPATAPDIKICAVCIRARAMETESVIERLERFPALLDAQLRAVPAAALDFAPADWAGVPSESLTIREQICHLRDIEAEGYWARFSRTLRETNPFLASIDTYALAASRDYHAARVDEALAAFRDARRQSVALLKAARTEDFARAADFEGYGRVTLLGLAHFLASHDSQHLAGVDWLLGKFASAK
jgi:hypothetical protein